eukprot:scpid88851/ scgid12299/ 
MIRLHLSVVDSIIIRELHVHCRPVLLVDHFHALLLARGCMMLQSLIKRMHAGTWRHWPKATVGVMISTLAALIVFTIYPISGNVTVSQLSLWLPGSRQSSRPQPTHSPEQSGSPDRLHTPFPRTTRRGSTTAALLSTRVPSVATSTPPPAPVPTAAAVPNQSRPDWDVYNWDMDYPKPVIPSDWTNLLNKHTMLQREMCSRKRPLSALVVTCRQPCYAMAEGLNAFMTAYSLAVVTGRAFFINSPSHFPVETYFNLANKESLLPGETGTTDWHMNDCEPLMKRFALAKSKGKDILPAADAASPIPAIISPIIETRFNCDIMKQLAVKTSLPEVLRV